MKVAQKSAYESPSLSSFVYVVSIRRAKKIAFFKGRVTRGDLLWALRLGLVYNRTVPGCLLWERYQYLQVLDAFADKVGRVFGRDVETSTSVFARSDAI